MERNTLKSKANSVTLAVIQVLNGNGWKTWRQNSVGVFDAKIGTHRKPPAGAIKGVPDVIGFHKRHGVFIGVEVKVGGDTMSEPQEFFHSELSKSGGVSLVVKSSDDFLEQFKIVKSWLMRLDDNDRRLTFARYKFCGYERNQSSTNTSGSKGG